MSKLHAKPSTEKYDKYVNNGNYKKAAKELQKHRSFYKQYLSRFLAESINANNLEVKKRLIEAVPMSTNRING